MKICNNISQTIGNTPLVRFRSIEKAFGLEAKIYAKIESFNPAGSAKDRVALFMINDAEEKGLIQPGATIIEPTSGNTGIGLAAVGEAAVLELARPREEDRRVALPDCRVCLPEQLFSRCVLQADGLGAVGVHRKGQIFVVNGRLHLSALSFFSVFLLLPVYSPCPEKPRGFTHSLPAE